MLTEKISKKIADHWGQCFNSDDLDQIMSQFQENVFLTSPASSKMLNSLREKGFEKNALRTSFEEKFDDYS